MKSDSEQNQNELNKSDKRPVKQSSKGITIVDKVMVFILSAVLLFMVVFMVAKILGTL